MEAELETRNKNDWKRVKRPNHSRAKQCVPYTVITCALFNVLDYTAQRCANEENFTRKLYTCTHAVEQWVNVISRMNCSSSCS